MSSSPVGHYRLIIGLALGLALLAAPGAAQTPPADVALVTRLSGEISYRNDAEKTAPARLQAFMKVRRGDHLKLPRAASLTLLYFASGRQETWRGPVNLVAGDTESAVPGGGKSLPQPEVKLISTRATRELQAAPLPLPGSSLSRSGGIQTMTPAGLAPPATPAASLSPEARRQIQEAEGLYRELSRSAGAADPTPELYLLSVLGKYGQYAAMAQVVDTMLRKNPGDADLQKLQAWVRAQEAKGQPAPAGNAGQQGFRGTFDEEMAAAGQKPEAAEIKNLLKQGWDYLEDGHGLQALKTYQEALKLSQQAMGPEHPLTAACMAQLARVYARLGFFDRALPLARQSLQIREKVRGPTHPQTAQSLMILGHLYAQMGDHLKAVQMNQRALKINEEALGPEDRRTAAALGNLAQLYSQMGSYDQALPLARRAVQIREKVLGLDDMQTAMSLADLGYLYLVKKDYGQAEACFRRAAHQKGDFGMAELYLATGKPADALSLLAKNPPKARSRPQFQALYYTQKGLALRGLGQRGEACAAFREAIKHIEELRARASGERTSFFEFGLYGGYLRAYKGMVGVLAEMAQKGESAPAGFQTYGPDPAAAAFYFAESIKARSLLEALAAGAAQAKPPLPADLAAREQSLQERLQILEGQRETVLTTRGNGRGGGGHGRGRREQAVQQFQGEWDALQRELDGFVTEVRRREPRYAALAYPQPYKAQELPLKSGEVLLEYALGAKESFLFRVEPGGQTRVFRLGVGQEALEPRLGAMLAPCRQGVVRREELSRFAVSEAAALYQELLAPALSGVNPGTRLIIVPDGVLGAFPFEALVVQAGPDWGKCTLVADRWPVTYSQSAAILALNRHLGTSHASQALFALGDPIFDKGGGRYLAYKSGRGQAGELKPAGPEKVLTMAATNRGWGRLEFPPLPETRQTVLELAALFQEKPQPPQVLLDVNATETRVRHEDLSRYRYLFFGTHGFLADTLAGVQEPTLVLTQVENQAPDNGFLSLSKVVRLKLDAEVVTLAACMTGVGRVMQGEGVLNFARAFQQAGARSVMVSLWNIPVAASMKFYDEFYKALKEGKPKIEALKVARQAVRAQEPHPYFWSGLILHGEG